MSNRRTPSAASTFEYEYTRRSCPPSDDDTHVRITRTMNGVVSWVQHPGDLHDIWSLPSPPRYPGRYGTAALTNPLSTRPRGERRVSERPFSSGVDGALAVHPRRGPSFTPAQSPTDLRRSHPTWPPRGLTLDSVLMPREAAKLVYNGASTFKGYIDAVPHAPSGHYRLYAVMNEAHDQRTDKADSRHEAFKSTSLTVTGSKTSFPWLCLEQPSMVTCFGKYPGTTSLNYWIGQAGCLDTPIQYGTDLKPRHIGFLAILDRLKTLEKGLEEDPDELYEALYGHILHDPDVDVSPHRAMEVQITDLITILTNPDWIDYSVPKNQVLAKFFDSEEESWRRLFYHQLLLSMELYLRIHLNHHTDKAKKKLLLKLPPKISWDLAVAERWAENMTIKKKSSGRPSGRAQSKFSFVSRTKERQKEAMRLFASTLKWPNMEEVKYVLQESDKDEAPLEDRSADATSWFLGTLLPGQTLPWILMNALIDCDRDTKGALKYLTHMHPAAGFQYRANTYWSHDSIVGKVLGASRGVNEIAGWIGPCISTSDLKRTECARIHQARGLDPEFSSTDAHSMSHRSDPLGPESLVAYSVDAFDLVVPDTKDVNDSIRMQKLELMPVTDQPKSDPNGTPLEWHAIINFASGNRTVRLWLKHDTQFVAAYPCDNGPHVLFHEYKYRAVRVGNHLLDLYDWAIRSRSEASTPQKTLMSPPSPRLTQKQLTYQQRTPRRLPHDRRRSSTEVASRAMVPAGADREAASVSEVLVIEAFGVSDNEVLARAWCAYEGVNAIVANVHETCMACAVREAYAACISVVILTAGGSPSERDKGVRVS